MNNELPAEEPGRKPLPKPDDDLQVDNSLPDDGAYIDNSLPESGIPDNSLPESGVPDNSLPEHDVRAAMLAQVEKVLDEQLAQLRANVLAKVSEVLTRKY